MVLQGTIRTTTNSFKTLVLEWIVDSVYKDICGVLKTQSVSMKRGVGKDWVFLMNRR